MDAVGAEWQAPYVMTDRLLHISPLILSRINH
jgi:hypothetical protein